MKRLSVLHAKRLGIYSCRASDSLKVAARLMQSHNISALVVVDAQERLDGVISRTDLVRAGYESPEWDRHTVADYMAADVVTVAPDDTLERVMALLLQNHIHRVVAVEQDPAGGKPRPVAVLSAADVVYHMAQE